MGVTGKEELLRSDGQDRARMAKKEFTSTDIIKAMLGNVWSKDQPDLRWRVGAAGGLLISSKAGVCIRSLRIAHLFSTSKLILC